MSHFPRPRSAAAGRQAAPRAAVLSAALALTAAVFLSGCTRTVTTTGAATSPAATSAPAPAAGTPTGGTPTGGTPTGGNAGLRVLDSTAAQNGLTGNGGTVTGAAVQEQPPLWAQLSAFRSAQLGTHLVDVNQSTLYRFDKDSAQPPTSNCAGDCAVTWPPVTVQEGGRVYLSGVDPHAVGAIRRTDGLIQLTVGGWPVYRFAQDTRPGDARGQGVGGTWFAVSPVGGRAQP